MFCGSGNVLVEIITTVAMAIAEGRDNEEVELLGSIFIQLGDTLTTIAAQREIVEKRNKKLCL